MGVYWVKSLLMDTSTSALFDSLQVVILLQIIIMVSPGTHFVRNCESHCRTSESQLKKQQIRNWKYFGLYVTRQLN